MENNSFKNNLDELIEVFKRLKNKEQFKTMLNNETQLKNIEMLINNYDFIKNSIPDDILDDLGENIQEIIIDLTNQLKQELGEIETEENKEYFNDIKMIDNILSEQNLPEDKINELLDKRNSLSNNS
jgi:hypothetical protein